MSRNLDNQPDSPNPYAPPSAAIELPPIATNVPELRLFFRWEKLRTFYNTVLVVETQLSFLLYPPPLPWPELVSWLVILAVLANVAFCLGPVLDGYANWLGLGGLVTSLVIFVLGTIVAALLAYETLVNFGDLPSF